MKLYPNCWPDIPDVDVAYLGQKKDSNETMEQIRKFFLACFPADVPDHYHSF